jgi:hypothetical protein
VPKQYSAGGKATLLGFNKRGNNYLRKILILADWAALDFYGLNRLANFPLNRLNLPGSPRIFAAAVGIQKSCRHSRRASARNVKQQFARRA